jgi:hypothetical protein
MKCICGNNNNNLTPMGRYGTIYSIWKRSLYSKQSRILCHLHVVIRYNRCIQGISFSIQEASSTTYMCLIPGLFHQPIISSTNCQQLFVETWSMITFFWVYLCPDGVNCMCHIKKKYVKFWRSKARTLMKCLAQLTYDLLFHDSTSIPSAISCFLFFSTIFVIN